MRGYWYIVALFYLAGYLHKVIGFLSIVILIILLNLHKNRLLLFISFSFYFLSVFLSPTLSNDTIDIEEPIEFENWIKIESDPIHKSNYIETIGTLQQSDERYLLRVNPEKYNVNMRHGSSCLVKGTMRLPREPTNEGQFNYRQYLKTQGIFYEVNDVEVFTCEGRSILSYLHEFRSKWQQTAQTLLSDKSYPWVNAIIFGDRSLIDEETIDLYQFWNISHLLAISGLHVGLTLAIFYFIFQRIFNWSKETTALMMMIIIPIYIVIAGANPPVLRAGFMALLVIVWQIFKKKLDSVDVISIVFIFLLIQQPMLLYQLSFQFSFAVTFSLILSSKLFKNDTWFMLSMKISMISQLAILPLQFEYFYFTNIFSFLMNLIFVPYFTIFVIPISLLLLTIMYFESLLLVVEPIFIFINDSMGSLLRTIGSPSFTIWVFGKPSIIVIFLYYLFFILFMKYWDLQKLKRAAIYAVLSIGVLMIQSYSPYFDSTYTIKMLDVGQSEVTVIELPYRKGVFLIDSGEEFRLNEEHENQNFNNIIKPYLWSKGIQKIDGLFISHFDLDHSGSMDEVIKQFKPTYVFTHPYINDEINGVKEHIKLSKGMNFTLKGANIHVLSPKINETNIDDENDLSLVFSIEVNHFKALFTGDISKKVEEEMVKENMLNHVHLLKIAHHGSDSSTSSLFLKETNPQFAIISVGKNNLYNQPHRDVIKRLRDHNITYYRTDINGAITFKIKNGQLTVSLTHP